MPGVSGPKNIYNIIPCLYEDSPRTKTKISHRVGDLNLEGELNLQENL